MISAMICFISCRPPIELLLLIMYNEYSCGVSAAFLMFDYGNKNYYFFTYIYFICYIIYHILYTVGMERYKIINHPHIQAHKGHKIQNYMSMLVK